MRPKQHLQVYYQQTRRSPLHCLESRQSGRQENTSGLLDYVKVLFRSVFLSFTSFCVVLFYCFPPKTQSCLRLFPICGE